MIGKEETERKKWEFVSRYEIKGPTEKGDVELRSEDGGKEQCPRPIAKQLQRLKGMLVV